MASQKQATRIDRRITTPLVYFKAVVFVTVLGSIVEGVVPDHLRLPLSSYLSVYTCPRLRRHQDPTTPPESLILGSHLF